MKIVKFIISFSILVICLSSCNKGDSSSGNISGKWSAVGGDVYYDNTIIQFNKLDVGVVCLLEDNSTYQIYDPMEGGIGSMVTYDFNKDGGVYIMGMKIAYWNYSNGLLTITNAESGEVVSTGTISDGYILLEEDSIQALGYQFREMFDYSPIDEWIGYDGNLHEVKYIIRLGKN